MRFQGSFQLAHTSTGVVRPSTSLMVCDVHVDVRQRTCRLAFLFVCWDNQSSSLCDSDPEFRGIMTSWGLDRLSRRTGSISRESLSQRTAQSPFRSRVAIQRGGVSDFLEVFCVRSTGLGGCCGRMFLLKREGGSG